MGVRNFAEESSVSFRGYSISGETKPRDLSNGSFSTRLDETIIVLLQTHEQGERFFPPDVSQTCGDAPADLDVWVCDHSLNVEKRLFVFYQSQNF
jgi:hypothetical protein